MSISWHLTLTHYTLFHAVVFHDTESPFSLLYPNLREKSSPLNCPECLNWESGVVAWDCSKKGWQVESVLDFTCFVVACSDMTLSEIDL